MVYSHRSLYPGVLLSYIYGLQAYKVVAFLFRMYHAKSLDEVYKHWASWAISVCQTGVLLKFGLVPGRDGYNSGPVPQ